MLPLGLRPGAAFAGTGAGSAAAAARPTAAGAS